MPRLRETVVPGRARITFFILGMFDNAGRERVHRALECVDGARDVHVSLHRSCATIRRGPRCKPGDLAWSVLSEGFGVWLEGDPGCMLSGCPGLAVRGRAGMSGRLARPRRKVGQTGAPGCHLSRGSRYPKGAVP